MDEPGILLTLHYSIGAVGGGNLVSTFGARPATLLLGAGELAAGLERCLEQAQAGIRQTFEIEPAQAFGAHREDLLRRLPRAAFAEQPGIEAGTVVEFKDDDGGVHPGIVRSAGPDELCIDFNHPLAGRAVRFEVEVLARNVLGGDSVRP
ncbi:MAG: FKBP-type peptidyl-prolyl cis-trans isomerase [Betaproteobacteria bacterium]|nr:FKBP-type peptidyl-prolyl cis-trans isomerase [Betaproteobacteria bacterium]